MENQGGEEEEEEAPPPSQPLSPGVGIFWDLESCPIPKEGVNPTDIVDNICSALDAQLPAHFVEKFIAYGERYYFPIWLLKYWDLDGMEVRDVDGGYDLYRQLLSDLMGFCLDNRYGVPAYIVLISRDVRLQRLANEFHGSRARLLLVFPSSDHVSHLAGDLFLDWSSVALGSAKIIYKDEGRFITAPS